MSTHHCDNCGEEVAEDELFGEWDDLCVACWVDQDREE